MYSVCYSVGIPPSVYLRSHTGNKLCHDSGDIRMCEVPIRTLDTLSKWAYTVVFIRYIIKNS